MKGRLWIVLALLVVTAAAWAGWPRRADLRAFEPAERFASLRGATATKQSSFLVAAKESWIASLRSQ